MTITRSGNLTFEPLTCGRSMISRHMTFLLVGVFTQNDMSDMWFEHRLFPSNAWRQDQLLRLSSTLVT
jgi:hypothetical protein